MQSVIYEKFVCVEKMELGPIATNAFLLWEENGNGEAVLIDAPPFAQETVQQVLDRGKPQAQGDLADPWPLGSYGWGG